MCEVNTIIFPSSYFNRTKVDEDLQAEYDSVVNTGLFDIIIFGYDAWFNQGKLVLSKTPDECIRAVYRGWMMKPEQYMSFYEALLANNIRLVTTPEDYAAMHVFPNVYELVKEDTAKMRVFPLYEKLPCSELTNEFQRFMIKDYVKSVKGTDFPKYFDNTITQEELDRWMDVFYKYRGNLLTGGICVKEYLSLKKYGDKTNEFRVFYINHKIATVSRNSGQINISTKPPESLVEKYKLLPSCYYTVDFAELESGSWTIIEAGDGSVSGLSENQNYDSYFRALYYCFN
jgi:hypothetical protein